MHEACSGVEEHGKTHGTLDDEAHVDELCDTQGHDVNRNIHALDDNDVQAPWPSENSKLRPLQNQTLLLYVPTMAENSRVLAA